MQISAAVNDTIVHFEDKSMKLCHITNIPSTKFFGYGARINSLMPTSNALVIKYSTGK